MIKIELLESLRKAHKYSQQYISEKLGGKTYRTYQYKKSHPESITIQDLMILCNIYNLTPNDLLCEDDIQSVVFKSIMYRLGVKQSLCSLESTLNKCK